MGASGKLAENVATYSHPLEEKQWIRKVREEGSRAAFEKIFRRYYKRLHHFAYGYVGEEFAEDVVQAVFLKIWSQREKWNPPGTVKQYLFAAVRNEALNMVRHRRVKDDAEETVIRVLRELGDPSPVADNLEAEELRKAIQKGIDGLPSRCRQIFLLNRRGGLTYTEIADVLDISQGTVNTQMGRALKYMRKHLVEFLPFFLAAKFFTLFL